MPGGKCGLTRVFSEKVLATLVFHVAGGGDGDAVIASVFDFGDGVYDGNYQPIPGVELGSLNLVPEPTTAVLIGVGILGIAYTSRRR
jgi:hypothetical protein